MSVTILVWYAEGDPVRVDTFEEWQALEDGIQGVMEFEEELAPAGVPFRRQVNGCDWYIWEGGRIQSGPSAEVLGEWAPQPEGCSVCIKKSGPVMPDDEWEALYAEMWARRWP